MSGDLHDETDCGCDEYNELSRRRFLSYTGGMAGAIAFTNLFPEWLPRVTMAESFDSSRDVIVSIFLRGGADGLSLCVPFGDPNYYTGRPTIAIPRPDSTSVNKAIALDGFFGFPQAMRALLPAYQAKELLVVHATGLTDNTRSHFDAQYFMEVGKSRDISLGSGWLGRHLATASAMKAGAPMRAIGISSGLQQTLKGSPKALPIPDPANYGLDGTTATRAERTAWLRGDYSDTAEPVRSGAVDALGVIDLLRTIDFINYRPAGGAVYGNNGLGRALRSAAALIKSDIGVEALQLDVGGWDTHANQNPINGSMYNTMLGLGNALAAFHADVIGSGLAQGVTVVVLSEFGRNARENGSLGTDHGRGTAMFAMGRGIAGGKVLTNNWPGLAREQLESQQDLRVTIDYRDIMAEIVKNRLANANLGFVFPDYVPVMRGVTK